MSVYEWWELKRRGLEIRTLSDNGYCYCYCVLFIDLNCFRVETWNKGFTCSHRALQLSNRNDVDAAALMECDAANLVPWLCQELPVGTSCVLSVCAVAGRGRRDFHHSCLTLHHESYCVNDFLIWLQYCTKPPPKYTCIRDNSKSIISNRAKWPQSESFRNKSKFVKCSESALGYCCDKALLLDMYDTNASNLDGLSNLGSGFCVWC